MYLHTTIFHICIYYQSLCKQSFDTFKPIRDTIPVSFKHMTFCFCKKEKKFFCKVLIVYLSVIHAVLVLPCPGNSKLQKVHLSATKCNFCIQCCIFFSHLQGSLITLLITLFSIIFLEITCLTWNFVFYQIHLAYY